MDLSYIINELGEERQNYFNAVAPPVIQSSNFAFDTVAGLREALLNEYAHDLYSRGNNPTVNILRKKLAALDGAEDALVFGSGIAAVAVPVISLLKSGDHVICINSPYSWTVKLFRDMMPRYGVTCTFVDGTGTQYIEAAIRPETRLIYLESPNTFNFALQDIRAVASLARSRNILTLIDNSFCTPLFQRPVEMGIDLACQSATKYIGGHSDVLAGVLSGSRELIKKIFDHEFMNIGAILSPNDAWLLLRGLRTLELRLNKSAENAAVIVEYLKKQPKVDKVIWPFDPDFPQYELAKQQMSGCSGLFSFTLKDPSLEKIETFCNALRHILMAVSWGGHESLIMPAVSAVKPEHYAPEKEKQQLLRMYAGLESAEYLISDLEQAFAKIT